MPSESPWERERYDRDGGVDDAQKETSLDSKSFERWTTSDLSALLFCEHDERHDVGVTASGTKNTKYLLRLNYDTEGATERIACLRLDSCVWVMVESGSQHESKVLHLQRVCGRLSEVDMIPLRHQDLRAAASQNEAVPELFTRERCVTK